MFSSLVNKLVPLTAVTATGVILYRQLQHALKRNPLDLRRCDMERSFSQVLHLSDASIKAILPRLKEILSEALNSDEIVERLRNCSGDRSEIWEEFKVTAFSQLFSSVISVSYLILISHVQFAVLMGFNQNQGDPGTNVSEKFLQQLPHLCSLIKAKVENSIRYLTVRNQIKLSELKNALIDIEAVLQEDLRVLYKHVLSDAADGVTVNALQDVLTMDNAMMLHEDMVTHALDVCLRSISLTAFPNETLPGSNYGLDFKPKKAQSSVMVVAKLLPVLCDSIHMVTSDVRNGLVQQLMNIPKLYTFTANVFECFAGDKKYSAL